jgi:hypothetical protein
MVPYWEKRFEPQSPGGRRAVLRLLCVIWTGTLLTLLRPRPFQTVDFVNVGMISLLLALTVWNLASMDRSGRSALDRSAERRIAGRRLGDWSTLVFGALGCAGFIRFGDGGFDWLLAGACACLATYRAWRLAGAQMQPGM